MALPDPRKLTEEYAQIWASLDAKIETLSNELSRTIAERDDILEAYHDALDSLRDDVSAMHVELLGQYLETEKNKAVLTSNEPALGEEDDNEAQDRGGQIDYALDTEWLIDGEDYVFIGDKEIMLTLMVNNFDDRYTECEPSMSELNEYERMVAKRSMRRLLNVMPTARFYCTKDKCLFSDGMRQSWYNENKAAAHARDKGHKVCDLED